MGFARQLLSRPLKSNETVFEDVATFTKGHCQQNLLLGDQYGQSSLSQHARAS